MSHKREDLAAMMTALGYDARVLDVGLVTPDYLRAQYAAFSRPGADPCAEHYRAAAVVDYVRGLDAITDETLDELLVLAVSNPDHVNGTNIAYQLVRSDFLTDAQFERAAASIKTDAFLRLTTRLRLLRAMRKAPGDVEVLLRCAAEGDGDVHGALLRLPDVPRDVVAQVAERGANRRVRNIAAQMLRSRRFRSH